VPGQFTVEVKCEGNEYDTSWYYNNSSGDGWRRFITMTDAFRTELDPAEYGYLYEKEENTNSCGEHPRHLYV